jgi:hypothetical protein
MAGSTADLCWKEVAVYKLRGKTHPKVVCIHCQKTWHSNSRRKVAAHLKKCQGLDIYGFGDDQDDDQEDVKDHDILYII